jgi:hypothetical protein
MYMSTPSVSVFADGQLKRESDSRCQKHMAENRVLRTFLKYVREILSCIGRLVAPASEVKSPPGTRPEGINGTPQSTSAHTAFAAFFMIEQSGDEL